MSFVDTKSYETVLKVFVIDEGIELRRFQLLRCKKQGIDILRDPLPDVLSVPSSTVGGVGIDDPCG